MPRDYGIKASRRGSNVLTANAAKTLLDHRYPLFKVFMEDEGTLTMLANDGAAFVDITHNLGYKPLTLLYMEQKDGSDIRYLINGLLPFLPPGDEVFAYSRTDDTSFSINVFEPGSPSVVDKHYDYHYYIMYDDLGA